MPVAMENLQLEFADTNEFNHEIKSVRNQAPVVLLLTVGLLLLTSL